MTYMLEHSNLMVLLIWPAMTMVIRQGEAQHGRQLAGLCNTTLQVLQTCVLAWGRCSWLCVVLLDHNI